MHARSPNHFTTVRTEGAILPADLLLRIADGDRRLEGLAPDDFHRAGERLNEVINAAWNRLLGQWQTFQGALAKLPESDPVTSATRERWLLPLFRELDYGRLTAATAIDIDGKSYPVSHAWQKTPLHLVGWRIDLDRRTAGVAGAARTSPHSMVQELLNRSDDRLWGFVSNGRRLRILRDNVSLTRQAFVEFDLEAMLNGEVYADFALLWLLCHQSRVEGTASKESAVGEDSAGAAPHPSTCWLEKWSRSAQQTGTRALDTLRKGVEDAIVALGRGFVAHPANGALREQLRLGGADGGLSAQDYYRQVLRLVYRLLFLFVSEDRGLLLVPGADEPTRERFARFYSTGRLRYLAERHRGTRHCDLFQGVALVMQRLGTADGCPELGLPALGSFLWSDRATPDLLPSASGKAQGEGLPLPSPSGRGAGGEGSCRIANSDFLAAIRALAFTVDGNVLRAVDYRNLGAEELGSVYESLLELHPKIHADAGQFELDVAAGHERKTTGSYYTPTSLINCLLDSALDPVVDDRLKEADRLAAGKWKTEAEHREALQIVCRAPWDGSPIRPSDSAPTSEPAPAQLAAETTAAYIAARTPQWDKTPLATRYARLAEHALLNMKICDPACGSGHFLIAAAHRLAKRLAAVRTGDEEPSPDAVRHALRDVISHCIYGVDINPMAVELCKINLWLESLEPGKPLSFLDHHIQCGNSLLGATPALLAGGIPDDAFKPIEGDDKTVCSQLKKENKRERQDYASGQGYLFDPPIMRGNIAAEFAKLTAASEDTARDVASKEERYARLVRSADYETARLWADAWCAVFVWKKDKTDLGRLCPTERQFRNVERDPRNIHPAVRDEIRQLREQYQFFHWHLAFPDAFSLPSSEKAPRNEQTGWTAGFDVALGNPPWEVIKVEFADKADKSRVRHICAVQSFTKTSRRFPLGSHGKTNTMPLFAELYLQLPQQRGKSGFLLKTVIATERDYRHIFTHVVTSTLLEKLVDVENSLPYFADVHRQERFCLLTLAGCPTGSPAEYAICLQDIAQLANATRRVRLSANDLQSLCGGVCALPSAENPQELQILAHMAGQGFEGRLFEGDWGAKFFKMADTTEIANAPSTHHLDENEPDPSVCPVYEGKLFGAYDHRYATFRCGATSADISDTDARDKASPYFQMTSRYWMPRANIHAKLRKYAWEKRWIIVYGRKVNRNNSRTIAAAIIPFAGAVDTCPALLLPGENQPERCVFVVSLMNSFVFDYSVRQRLSGFTIGLNHLASFVIPTLSAIKMSDLASSLCGTVFFQARVVELSYTAWDLEAFSLDCGYATPPFRWDEDRRFLIRCELDAAYFHLYGIGRDAVDYIMGTFPIVRRKDEAAHGEYRTKRVILEIYDAMAESMRSGRPYQTLLDPPPGPPADGLPDWPPNQPRPANWPSHIHPPRLTEEKQTTPP